MLQSDTGRAHSLVGFWAQQPDCARIELLFGFESSNLLVTWPGLKARRAFEML